MWHDRDRAHTPNGEQTGLSCSEGAAPTMVLRATRVLREPLIVIRRSFAHTTKKSVREDRESNKVAQSTTKNKCTATQGAHLEKAAPLADPWNAAVAVASQRQSQNYASCGDPSTSHFCTDGFQHGSVVQTVPAMCNITCNRSSRKQGCKRKRLCEHPASPLDIAAHLLQRLALPANGRTQPL